MTLDAIAKRRRGGRAADRVGDGDGAVGDLEDALLGADAFILVDETDPIAVEVGKLCLGEWARLSAVVLSTVLEPDLYKHANTSWVSPKVEDASRA